MDAKAAFRLRVLEGEQRRSRISTARTSSILSSNNYLGLTTHEALRRAAIARSARTASEPGRSARFAGTMDLHMALEDKLRIQGGRGRRLSSSPASRQMAGTVAAFSAKTNLILSDELNHASIIDGCRLSRAAIRFSSKGCCGLRASLQRDRELARP